MASIACRSMTMRRGKKFPVPRPFLKWAGGKGQLLGELVPRALEAGLAGRYYEPFTGGGALFFELARMEKLSHPGKACLSDVNPKLITVYLAVRDDVERLIRLLEEHRERHCEEHYLAVRASVPENSSTAFAARIVYLNKTCFNGLYRENSRGEFNVPMGKYDNPPICDAENLRAASAALQHTDIACRPFDAILSHAQPGDFVYFDPPYHPVSETSRFTNYAMTGFGEEDQRRLARVYEELTRKGVKTVLSNSWTPLVLDLYERLAPLGVAVDKVQATRHINSRADRRGAVSEVLVRNFPFSARDTACPVQPVFTEIETPQNTSI